jgi:AcrR family transcriptional regulator
MSTQAQRRPRGRPRDAAADAAILQAALDLFIERGVEGTSIEQVAKLAGVGKLTVYRRWQRKEELIAAAVEAARDDPPASTTDAPVADIVRAAAAAQAELIVAPRFRAMVARVLGTTTSHPEIMATYWTHYIAPRRAAFRPLLERARAEGSLPAHTDVDTLMDMMAGAVLYRLTQPGALDAPTMRHYLEAVYQQAGLLPPPDSRGPDA